MAQSQANDAGAMIAKLQRKIAALEKDRNDKLAERDAALAQEAALTARLATRDTEFSERLSHQAATNDVLQAMSASPSDPQPVFDLIAMRARDICDAYGVTVTEFDGTLIHHRASTGISDDPAVRQARIASFPMTPTRASLHGRAILDRLIVRIDDLELEPGLDQAIRRITSKSAVTVPLMRHGKPIGTVAMGSRTRGGFSDSQVELLKTFAEQAVIAITSAETYRALQARTAELATRNSEYSERIDHQAATIDVLQAMSASPGDPQPVFDLILHRFQELCGIYGGAIFEYDGKLVHVRSVIAGLHRSAEAVSAFTQQFPMAPTRASVACRAILDRKIIHIRDMWDEADVMGAVRVLGHRSNLSIPLLRDGVVIGSISGNLMEPGGFSESQVELAKTFAEQAVIAITSAETYRALQTRTSDLQESLEQQTATAEVLGVINASPGSLAPVFDTILKEAMRLCGAAFGAMFTWDGRVVNNIARRGYPAAFEAYLDTREPTASVSSTILRLVETKRPAHMADIREGEPYRSGHPDARAVADLGGARTILIVPLMKDGSVLGYIVVYRQTVRLFADKEVALLENFAAQASIAMENARLMTETREALERQTATAEILQVINASPGILAPVFDAMLEKAMQLCEAAFGSLYTYDGKAMQSAAQRGVPEAFATYRAKTPPVPGVHNIFGRMLMTRAPVQVLDAKDQLVHGPDQARASAVAELGGARSIVGVPLLKDGTVIGFISIYRQEVRPFSDKQVALLENFAAQAVIAMENARLITEQREALEQQTATAEVLGVINAHPGDLRPVFEAMLDKAMALCNAAFGELHLFDGERFIPEVLRDVPPALEAYQREHGTRGGPGTTTYRVIAGEDVVHIEDATAEDAYRNGDPARRARVDLGGVRSQVSIALRKDGNLLGMIRMFRQVVRPFDERQIALLRNFAAQAVIAMENARLMTETREALERQTATAEVLATINAHPGNVTPVFETILEKAHTLCGSTWGNLVVYENGLARAVAIRGSTEAVAAAIREPTPPSPRHQPLIAGARFVHVADIQADASNSAGTWAQASTMSGENRRTGLWVPLRNEKRLLGWIAAFRSEVRPFSDKEIALLENFAAQAVIAMENARLLDELRQRTEALARRNTEFGERIEQQSATIDVLKVMSGSPGDPQPVFDLIAHRAREFCGADSGSVLEYDGSLLHMRAIHASPEDMATARAAFPRSARRDSTSGRAVLTSVPAHIADIATDADYRKERDPNTAAMLAVPMLREGAPIGVVTIGRSSPGYFTEVQIELLKTFAEQAVIAVTSAETYHALRRARDAAEASLADLRRAQDRLVQSEKMASLGQLTAGIAHEIKNPLNFVNNFSDLSTELLDELNAAIAPLEAVADPSLREEIDDLTETLKGNLQKIAEHGKRADSIVKNMLEHSRTGTSERRAVNFNALAEEALNLAYHGARAEIPGFNITMEKALDPGVGDVELYPQEFTRVLLNLFSNGFYATRKRTEQAQAGYEPTLRIATRSLGDQVEITVRDNGTGMPANVREKIFEPFFTTKPAGEGTGLGLSLSFDIVVKQHGGHISVDSDLGQFTEFRVSLPRHASAMPMATAEGTKS